MIPALDIDRFCQAFFDDPFPAHAAMRDADAVVYLLAYDIYAVARYEDVRTMLAGWRSFSSARGVGIPDFAKEKPWRLPSLLLETDPSLARAAFEEAVRLESPVQSFFRTTTRDVAIGEQTIPGGGKLLMFLGAANRDPRRWKQPDTYDIMRRNAGHVGFGTGIHGCVGAVLARLKGELLLGAMARKVAAIEIVGAPPRRYNNTLRAMASLRMRMRMRAA